jgi:hypothetical protein
MKCKVFQGIFDLVPNTTHSLITMTTPGRVSNFQEFQKVLKRGRLSTVLEDSAPVPKSGATVVEHHTTNSEGPGK